MSAASHDSLWERLRYGPLLRASRRSPAGARRFASIVAAVERRLEAERVGVAEDRIMRWLGVSRPQASRIFRDALFSEALEEADSARMMAHPSAPLLPIEIEGHAPRGGRPRIYAALHAGSPVLAFMGLRKRFEPDVRIIARELDEENPMANAKQAFALRKVAWVEEVSGAKFIDTDGEAILEARDHLLSGRPLFAAVDVPGDVVSRTDRVGLFGETVVLASGIFRLAAMTGADMQLVVSEHRDGRILVRCRPPFEASDAASLLAAMAPEMEAVLRDQPGEFWFWPFFVSPQMGDS